jgi:hypothetical protein
MLRKVLREELKAVMRKVDELQALISKLDDKLDGISANLF